jgi:hypothetical protein
MSAVVVVELLGITGAAIGIALAQSPPRDLRAWWSRQEWLHDAVMPGRDGSGVPGLTILPWSDEPDGTVTRPAASEPPVTDEQPVPESVAREA